MVNPIVIHCDCGQKIRAKASMAGESYECPKCGTAGVVPFPFAEPSPEPPTPIVAPPSTMVVRGRSSRPAVALSVVALVVSIATLWLSLFPRDPLSGYDLSTPEGTVRSRMQAVAAADAAAVLAMSNHGHATNSSDVLDTLKIHKEMRAGPAKLLFATYTVNGVDKREVFSLELDPDTTLWYVVDLPVDAMKPDSLSAVADWLESRPTQ